MEKGARSKVALGIVAWAALPILMVSLFPRVIFNHYFHPAKRRKPGTVNNVGDWSENARPTDGAIMHREAVEHWNAGIVAYQAGKYQTSFDEWTSCLQSDASDSDCAHGLERLGALGYKPAPTPHLFTYATSTKTEFHVSSFDSPFALAGKYDGYFMVQGDSLEVVVTKAAIRLQDRPNKEADRVQALRIGLGMASGPKGRGWDMDTISPEFGMDVVIAIGRSFTLASERFVIPIRPGTDLSKRWLVFVLRSSLADGTGGGESFAHSSRDIFKNLAQ